MTGTPSSRPRRSLPWWLSTVETREVREGVVREHRVGVDLVGEGAEPGTEDDADARVGGEMLADRRGGFVYVAAVESYVHGVIA